MYEAQQLFVAYIRRVRLSNCTRLTIRYDMVYVNLYSAIVANISNALRTLVPRKQPSFQALFEGTKVLLYAEVVRQRVSHRRAMHSECSAANSGEPVSWHNYQLLCG